MIRCEAVRPLLSPFFDGVLAGPEREEVGAHVALCSDCGRSLDSLRGLSRLLKSAGHAPLPAGFFDRLERRRSRPLAYSARGAPVYGLAFVAAGALLIVIANRRTASIDTAPPPLAAARGAAFDGLAPAGKDGPVALSAPAPMIPKSSGASGGQPLGTRKAYTNEEMQKMLQAETRREGMVAAGPEQEEDEEQNEPFLGRQQLGVADTRAQAEDAIRQIAEMRHDVERGSDKKRDVPIAGNVAPVLSAAQAERGRALVAAAEDTKASVAPPAQPAWDDGMAGAFSGGLEGTLTIMDDKAWSDAWARLSKDPKPAVDFTKKEIVGVFLGSRPTGGYAVKILWVGDEGPALVVRWQEASPPPGTAAPDGATSPYALKVITRTDLPVRYEKQP